MDRASAGNQQHEMVVTLAIHGTPQLTDHEAHALATLLLAIRTPCSLRLAERLDPRAGARTIDLSEEEKRALLGALRELCDERIPQHLVALEETLADLVERPASSST